MYLRKDSRPMNVGVVYFTQYNLMKSNQNSYAPSPLLKQPTAHASAKLASSTVLQWKISRALEWCIPGSHSTFPPYALSFSISKIEIIMAAQQEVKWGHVSNFLAHRKPSVNIFPFQLPSQNSLSKLIFQIITRHFPTGTAGDKLIDLI